jgi:hypothetical protein
VSGGSCRALGAKKDDKGERWWLHKLN